MMKSLTSMRPRAVMGGLAIALAAALAVPAFAHAPGPRGGGMGGPGMMLFAGSPERISRAVDHLLNGLNASDAQRSQIKQIAQAAAADLKQQHAAARSLHQQEAQIFTAPTVDANAAEQLRQRMLAQHDQASRRVTQAMVDVAQVLTPEQRAALGQRLQKRAAAWHDRMGADPAQR